MLKRPNKLPNLTEKCNDKRQFSRFQRCPVKKEHISATMAGM